MSHHSMILAQVPLPERPGGWHGQSGRSPLWYAAVNLNVTPWNDARPVYAEHAAAQGGCTQVLSLSYRHAAVEFADRYIDVLRLATGGTVITNGVVMSKLPARPSTVEAIEQALFEQDLAELDHDPPDELPHDWSDDEMYELYFNRPRPNFGPEGGLVYLLDRDPPATIPGVRVQTLREWVDGEPNRLGIAAQVVRKGRSLARTRAVVTELRGVPLSADEEDARERFFEVLIDVYRAREIDMPRRRAW